MCVLPLVKSDAGHRCWSLVVSPSGSVASGRLTRGRRMLVDDGYDEVGGCVLLSLLPLVSGIISYLRLLKMLKSL